MSTVFRNHITATQQSAIALTQCASINISENTVVDNRHAFEAASTLEMWSNIIYHNNFINNEVWDISDLVGYEWDNGYPSGGNYWSAYDGTDFCHGIYQNETGGDEIGDGIGDTAYHVFNFLEDRYPLMEPWSVPQLPIGDVNMDGIVDIQDITAIASVYGCTESDPRWRPRADLTSPYGTINMLDLVACASHYGEKGP
jgi:hypothetical protein